MHGKSPNGVSFRKPEILAEATGVPPDDVRLGRVRVVLCRPSHPGNIGAAARAMKTMGLRQLVLVSPRRFPDPEADVRSSNAREVLASARVVTSLAEALRGTVAAVATVSHQYETSLEMVSCRDAAARAVDASVSGDVAFVFGTEASGLTADEVRACTLAAHIPCNPAYTSLNLAAAVQIFAYEARLAAVGGGLPSGEMPELATHEDIERLHAHLEEAMVGFGFLDPAHPKRLLPRMRRLVARARLEVEEVRILRGLLKSASRTMRRNR
ncbi:MAG: TrmJ/YjtD family RNA methyltransferase [Betaproteobacteria bacterium]|nr:TrmJ/YjtD family RNA methyltransferase [Betaproteobacteria bacterium]